MIFDYYASLTGQKDCPSEVDQYGLASGFVDRYAWAFASAEIDRVEAEQKEKKARRNSQEEKNAREEKKEAENRKNDARKCYMKRACELEDLKLPEDLNFEPDFSQLPHPSWFGIEVEFTLLSPWYSKDDRPFHVLDNPVRKDKVFGVPFMSAASWKGLLRWACRMQAGLYRHLESHGMKTDDWKDPAWIVHLFGNERVEGEEFSRGALQLYPTWFDKVGFEVINPHNRRTRAGTQPMYYEVVPAGTKGKLRLLYAPLPGKVENDKVNPVDVIVNLIDGITALLERYGISAKRTAGWGAVEVKSCSLFFMEGSWIEENIGSDCKQKCSPPEEKFKKLLDENGNPIEILLDEGWKLLSKTQFKKLGSKKPDCTNAEFDSFKDWYEKHGEEYRKRLNRAGDRERLPRTLKRSFNSLAELKSRLENARKGGGR